MFVYTKSGAINLDFIIFIDMAEKQISFSTVDGMSIFAEFFTDSECQTAYDKIQFFLLEDRGICDITIFQEFKS